MNEWKLIELAPKDGTKILGKLRDSDVLHTVHYKDRCGWRISWDDYDLDPDVDGPTHWLPMPQLPTL